MKKYKSKIYLLKIDTPDKRLYKIGSTRNSIHERIKSLQTGCPYEIELINYHESDYGQIVERTLQNNFKNKQTFGEWFELDISDEFNFKERCNQIENINENIQKNKSI